MNSLRNIKTSVLNTDSYDVRRFNEIIEMSDGLDHLSKMDTPPLFKELLGDIWASFYKMNPELDNVDDVDTKLKSNYNIMNQIMNEDFYQKHHKSTQLDDMLSVIGTREMGERTVEWFEEELQKNEKMKEQLKKIQKLNKKIEKEQKKKQQDESTADSDEQSNNKPTQTENDLNNLLDEFADSVQGSLDSSGKELMESLTEGMENAEQTNDNLEKLFGGRAKGSGESDLDKIPLRDKIKLAELISKNPKLKRIADWAGRFKRIARSKHKSLYTEGVSRGGVTLGNDLRNVLPSEIFLYFDERTKKDFAKRFDEKKLLQYETTGKDNLGQGSIVLCLDQSGSMSGLDEQSKAFTLALMSIARRQGRNFVYIPFSKNAGTVRTFIKGKIKPFEMIDIATSFLNGGTSFEPPLKEALKVVSKDKFGDGDIIFVTDGESSISRKFVDEFNKTKKDKDFSVMSLVIGRGKESTVKQFSNEIVKINEFNEEGAFEAFEI